MAGFVFAYDLSGGEQRIKEYTVKDTTVISKGEMLAFDSGEVDTAASGETVLIGAAIHAADNTNDGESVKVIVNPFAVYRVADTTVRTIGATLDLASGGLGLTTSSNADFVVVDSDSTYTWVTFNAGTHFAN